MGVLDMLISPERRSLENPKTPLSDPDDWLYDAFGAVESSSGVRVSSESALRYSPWWRGINVISRDVAKIPLIVYERRGAGKDRATQHPAFRLLRHKANDELMTAFVFKQTIQSHVMSRGNGYALIRRNGDAIPLELILLMPDHVIPHRINGTMWYAVKAGMEWRRVNPVDILHIKGLSPDGLVGYSVFAKARQSLGLGMASEEYGSRFFSNSARPSVIIEVPNTMSEEAQREFLRQWNLMNTGLESSHRTAILTNGAKVHTLSINARDSQLIETRKFSIVDVANWIGVPVHKVGGEGRTSYGSLEQENQAYLDESLDPWLVNWEEECREKLLTEREKDSDSHVIEFMRNAIVRADMQARYNAYNIGIRGGWLNPDMVLAKENENPIPDGNGQHFFRPLELAVVGADEEPSGDIQKEALAAGQIASLLAIAKAVTDGQIPPEAAKAIIDASYPMLTDAEIAGIVGPLENFEPDPEPIVPVIEQPAEDPNEEPLEEPDDSQVELARQLSIESARRACRHMSVRADKWAKSSNFFDLIDAHREEHESRIREIMKSVVELCRTSHGAMMTIEEISDLIYSEAKEAMLGAAGSVTDVSLLPEAVASRMQEMELTLPDRVAKLLLKVE